MEDKPALDNASNLVQGADADYYSQPQCKQSGAGSRLRDLFATYLDYPYTLGKGGLGRLTVKDFPEMA